MNWLGILKIVAKVAVASGAADWFKGWLKKKLQGRALTVEKRAEAYQEDVKKKVDAVFEVLK